MNNKILLLINARDPSQEIKQKGIKKSIEATTKWFPSMHSLVVGPGLSRDPVVAEYLPDIIEAAEKQILIGDADFFWYTIEGSQSQRMQEMLKKKSSLAVLTPNKGEFSRLWKRILPGKVFCKCLSNFYTCKERVKQAMKIGSRHSRNWILKSLLTRM
jgi:NAD(P)H-hydrate repair Nnr-like enzyme with NAD(P)H-hydrate dehydratase domain